MFRGNWLLHFLAGVIDTDPRENRGIGIRLKISKPIFSAEISFERILKRWFYATMEVYSRNIEIYVETKDGREIESSRKFRDDYARKIFSYRFRGIKGRFRVHWLNAPIDTDTKTKSSRLPLGISIGSKNSDVRESWKEKWSWKYNERYCMPNVNLLRLFHPLAPVLSRSKHNYAHWCVLHGRRYLTNCCHACLLRVDWSGSLFDVEQIVSSWLNRSLPQQSIQAVVKLMSRPVARVLAESLCVGEHLSSSIISPEDQRGQIIRRYFVHVLSE